MPPVLDSSMSLTWCIPGQANLVSFAVLKRVQREGAIVPVVWHMEMANILGLKFRSGFLSSKDLHEAIVLLSLLEIKTEESTRYPNIADLLASMARVQLTTYDASYLDLALRTGSPLATFDKAMIEAARQNRITLATS